MATFKYIGTLTKADGTVDVRCEDSAGVMCEWDAVVPNVSVIDVGADARLIKCFDNAVDMMGNYTYEKVS
jgi:hypothetical protein